MGKIVDLIDGNIVISPECLVIEPFKTLWESDRTKTKDSAVNYIKYIWFYTDFNSPYFPQDDQERHDLICEYILKDKKFKVSKEIQKGIEVYNRIVTTPSIRLFKAVQESVVKMESFFRETEYNEDNITKLQKAIVDMPKLQEAVQTALENCRKEQVAGIRVRGNAAVGLFENE